MKVTSFRSSFYYSRAAGNILCAVALSLCLCACGPSYGGYSDSLVLRLKNRGPVALSTENPYLAGNLLLAREMESSPEIKGFVEHKGAPAAIEVEAGMFSPLLMFFYYPEARETYTLEQSGDIWIIRGPDMIEPEVMAKVAPLTREQQGRPPLALKDEVLRNSRASQDVGKSSDKEKEPAVSAKDRKGLDADEFLKKMNTLDPNLNTVKSEPFSSPAIPGYAKSDKSSAIHINTASEDAALVREILKKTGAHPAELSPKGDLVHYVTYPGETLTLISRWYTYDRSNIGRLVRINRLADPDKLSVGDEIIVPSYMIRNKSRLTEAAVREMKLKE